MGRAAEKAKAKKAPSSAELPRLASDPESYLKQTPVWRFCDFDWDGDWGYSSCIERVAKLRDHIEDHLANFETMTWGEILRASGGKKSGNNNHEIDRDKFKSDVRKRLDEKKILADTLFSLRLDAGTRVYGVREGPCLRIVFFDPFHKNKGKCAYDYS